MAGLFDRRSFLLVGAAATLSAQARSPEGLISLVGYNDMAEMLSALNAAFTRLHPRVRVTADLPGTRFGPEALASGRSTLAPMGARFTPAQLAAYAATAGREPEGFRIAHASLKPKALSGPNALFVHRDNPLRTIDLTVTARLFTHSGQHFWNEVEGAGPFQRRPIVLAGLAPQTPLALEFRDAVFPAAAFAQDFREFGQSRDVVNFIGREPAAFGFAALNRATDQVRVLGIKRGSLSPPVYASADTLRSGAYPLDRHLWLYARIDGRGRLSLLANAYLEFALSKEGQAIIGAGSLGYLPLGEAERQQEVAKLRG